MENYSAEKYERVTRIVYGMNTYTTLFPAAVGKIFTTAFVPDFNKTLMEFSPMGDV